MGNFVFFAYNEKDKKLSDILLNSKCFNDIKEEYKKHFSTLLALKSIGNNVLKNVLFVIGTEKDYQKLQKKHQISNEMTELIKEIASTPKLSIPVNQKVPINTKNSSKHLTIMKKEVLDASLLNHHTQNIKTYLHYGGNPEYTYRGMSILSWMCFHLTEPNSHEEYVEIFNTIKLLMHYKVNVNHKSGLTHKTPLHWLSNTQTDGLANEEYQIIHQAIKLLIENGADIMAKDVSKRTPLEQLTSSQKYIPIVDWLIDRDPGFILDSVAQNNKNVEL